MNRSVTPLAERMRPQEIDGFLGQKSFMGEGKFLRRLVEKGESQGFPSLIFWGPPGCGKTTLAKILSKKLGCNYRSLNAAHSGAADSRRVIEEARMIFENQRRRSLLFIDEIHRFKKNQQDVFLEALESGWILLIGATTENPSFELNRALLSRCRVLNFESIEERALTELLQKAWTDKVHGLGSTLEEIDPRVFEVIAHLSGGDARVALGYLESCHNLADRDKTLSVEIALGFLEKTRLQYDKGGELHYDLISALHKAIRNSDVEASLFWLARILDGGEDPNFVVRRLIRVAYEDVGLAEPQAAMQAIAAKEAVSHLGMPECDLALAQLTIYLALCPKSNSVYKSYGEAKKLAEIHHAEAPPLAVRNAPTKMMKDMGYGKGYIYDHDREHGVGPYQARPEKLKSMRFFKPGTLGFEKELQKRLRFFEQIRTTGS